MRIGLISDTHDNLARTRQAISVLRRAQIEVLLHAGDLTSGALVPFFETWPTWAAQGNVDDVALIEETIARRKSPLQYAEAHEVTLDGVRFGLLHGDDTARLEGMVNSGAFDLVVHGHTHRFRDEEIGATRLVNPGAVHRTPVPSVCVYDTETRLLERHALEVG